MIDRYLQIFPCIPGRIGSFERIEGVLQDARSIGGTNAQGRQLGQIPVFEVSQNDGRIQNIVR